MKKINTKLIRDYVQSENLSVVRSTRDKLVKGTSVALVVLSIVTGLAFSGPAEITADQVDTQINKPPVVMEIGDYANSTVEEDDDDATEEKKGFSAFVQRFKQAVLSLPKAVRILIVVPLWAVGTLLMTLVSVFWKFLFTSPLGGFILSALVGFAVLLGLFVITAKLLFPEIPLKKILRKRNVTALAIVSVLLAVVDAVAPLFWQQYPFAAGMLKLGSGLLLVSILCVKLKSRFNREQSFAQ